MKKGFKNNKNSKPGFKKNNFSSKNFKGNFEQFVAVEKSLLSNITNST